MLSGTLFPKCESGVLVMVKHRAKHFGVESKSWPFTLVSCSLWDEAIHRRRSEFESAGADWNVRGLTGT